MNKAIIYDGVISQILLHRELKNRKIVSLSIVGAFRKGKSFLLDYMLRYLYAMVSFAIKNGRTILIHLSSINQLIHWDSRIFSWWRKICDFVDWYTRAFWSLHSTNHQLKNIFIYNSNNVYSNIQLGTDDPGRSFRIFAGKTIFSWIK